MQIGHKSPQISHPHAAQMKSVPVEDSSLMAELCKGVILGPAQLEGKETPKCQPLIVPNRADAQLQAPWLRGGWWISCIIIEDG